MTSFCRLTAAGGHRSICVLIGRLVAVAIELNPDYVRALLRRAELYEQTEKLDEALEDYKKVLDRDPNQTSARQACMVSSLTAGTSHGSVSDRNRRAQLACCLCRRSGFI